MNDERIDEADIEEEWDTERENYYEGYWYFVPSASDYGMADDHDWLIETLPVTA